MVVIYESDSETVRKSKRIANLEEQKQTHILGAMELSVGIPVRCKVEQPGAQTRPVWDCIQKDTQWNNGEVRIRYQNGHNKYEYHMGFAGRARTMQQMNSGQ